MQIGDHVGALAVLGDTGKTHRGAGNEALRIGNELVKVVVGPGAAFGLHRRREIEPASFASMVANDPEKIGADAVGAALLEGVAGGAFFCSGGTLFDRSGLQRLPWRRLPALPSRRSRTPAFPASRGRKSHRP